MIYTVTFNPALDYVVKVDNFTTGTVNRTVSEEILRRQGDKRICCFKGTGVCQHSAGIRSGIYRR